MASVDDDDDDFEREKGMKTGKSAELVQGKDIGKKRLISQNTNQVAGGDGRNI